jgi:phosphoadenylyl-sulfate reductase (thioredoxin)
VIAWALDRFPRERRVVVTGLQAEGVAVADMAIGLDPDCRVLTIDTGRLPDTSHQYIDQLSAQWGRAIEVVKPDSAEVEAFTSRHGLNVFYESAALRLDCCHLRKVAPLERVLVDVDCWMSGVRRGQTSIRAATDAVEIDERRGGIIKLNPVVAWSEPEVRGYLSDRGIPAHPLYELGYHSIGCAPCTRPVVAGEDPRAGRWWWESGVEKECGIHATRQAITHGAGVNLRGIKVRPASRTALSS